MIYNGVKVETAAKTVADNSEDAVSITLYEIELLGRFVVLAGKGRYTMEREVRITDLLLCVQVITCKRYKAIGMPIL